MKFFGISDTFRSSFSSSLLSVFFGVGSEGRFGGLTPKESTFGAGTEDRRDGPSLLVFDAIAAKNFR